MRMSAPRLYRMTDAACRQRRYRQRQKLGRYVIPVEVDDADIECLMDAGLLKDREARDRNGIAGAIRSFVKSLAEAEK